MVAHGLATILAFSSFLPIGYIRKYFSQHCILYGTVKLQEFDGSLGKIRVDERASQWGDPYNCDFCTYVPVVTAIHAFMWGWFTTMMGNNLKLKSRSFGFVVPGCGLLHAVFTLLMLVTSAKISAGKATWCRNLLVELRRPAIQASNVTCPQTQDLLWDQYSQHSYYSYLLTAEVSSWVLTLTLFCHTGLCGYKLYIWTQHMKQVRAVNHRGKWQR